MPGKIGGDHEQLTKATAWLAYLDIYGFGIELTEPTLSSVSERLHNLHQTIEILLAGSQRIHLYMLSDSIVLFSDYENKSKAAALSTLINALVKLQVHAIQNNFVFRGVVTNGTIIYGGHVCLGAPLLRAVRLEAQLAIPVVIVPEIELDRKADVFRYDSSAPVLIPTKQGLLLGTPILPAPIDKLRNLARDMMLKCAKNGPDHVAKVWAELEAFIGALPQGE